jgi:hypothetical protein
LPEFSEHINQALHNLEILGSVNSRIENSWDWQVTICYYIAVHLVNAHVAKTCNLHYRSHSEVESAINFMNQASLARLNETVYLSFIKLNGLSRRSRYLINDNLKRKETQPHFTYTVHLAKAIRQLDVILGFFVERYLIKLPVTNIKCIDLNKGQVKYFKIVD